MSVGLVFTAAPPANAYSSGNTNWSNVPSVYQGTQGDLVGLWQGILWSEYLLHKCVSQYANSSIDGYFGSITANNSEAWQSRYGVGVDGIIGSESWSRAYSMTYKATQFGDKFSQGFRVYDAGSASTRVVWTHRYLSTDAGWWPPKGEWHHRNPANPGQGFLPRFVKNDFNFYTC
jgi:hypothetical protein